jgi:hypothetical protein
MKTWRVMILASAALTFALTFPLAPTQSYTAEPELNWKSHQVIGSGKTSVGKIKYKLVWKEPHLLEGTAQHEVLPFLKPKSPCTWRFAEDFSHIQVTIETKMMGNPSYTLTRVNTTNTYQGVWEAGFPVGTHEMTLTIYPNQMLGSVGDQQLCLKITPPLAPEEVPPGLQFIFEEEAV